MDGKIKHSKKIRKNTQNAEFAADTYRRSEWVDRTNFGITAGIPGDSKQEEYRKERRCRIWL